jgi:hypothetical protein
MRRLLTAAAGVSLLAALGACQEKLATPTDCPELCPGTSLTIRDTVLFPTIGLDSTYTGYLDANGIPALLVSSGLDAGEARTFAVFPRRSDSVFVDGSPVTYTIDSVALAVNIVARDSTVHGLKLYFHRVPVTLDTTSTFADVDGSLTQETLIDSLAIPDTLKSGGVQLVLKGDALDRVVPAEADSGRIAIGIRVGGPAPTGVRLASANTSQGGPVISTYVKANVADTAKQKQLIAFPADRSNYVMDGPPPPGPDELFLGGKSGSRVILRFALPPVIKDSGSVLRATLDLTPVGPLKGLPNDPAELQVRAILLDVGAKSPALAGVSAVWLLEAGATGVQAVDMRGVVRTWLGPSGLPASLLLGLAPEGGTFSRPEFFSSSSGAGMPQLRVTYALASHPGHP